MFERETGGRKSEKKCLKKLDDGVRTKSEKLPWQNDALHFLHFDAYLTHSFYEPEWLSQKQEVHFYI
jgi:hypothetical protein